MSLNKDYEHKTLTSQSIKLCKIIATYLMLHNHRYKRNSYNKILSMLGLAIFDTTREPDTNTT